MLQVGSAHRGLSHPCALHTPAKVAVPKCEIQFLVVQCGR
jgi:hypothetical protein